MGASDGGPMFIKTIDGSSEYKDKHFIVELLKDAIKDIGYEKVVQVITDNANVMKATGALIEERSKSLERYFVDEKELRIVKIEFDTFSGGRFPAFKLLRQLGSSSCAERNWSTYKFIHSLKRNKIVLAYAEDLAYVHSNLQLLSRHNEEYVNAATKIWNIARDSWNESDIHGGARILEIATLTLDEPELEAMVIGNASTSVTISESEVQNETIDLENDDDICI